MTLRRQLRLLQAYSCVSFLLLIFVAVAAFTQPARPEQSRGALPQKIDEITVQRLNVVDANGTLRMIAAGKDRMHPGVMDGVTINRPRPVAGLIFFNDEGDEVGGLAYSGQEQDGERRASALLAFDQLKQDQTVGISYSEANGERTAGLQVWDRADTRLSELIRKLNAANAIADPDAREKAVKAARADAPPGPRRLFAGKTSDRAATVSLADAAGKPRLTLKVAADGDAAIEFLDADGRVVRRIPASQ
jgi:hypothetical protein